MVFKEIIKNLFLLIVFYGSFLALALYLAKFELIIVVAELFILSIVQMFKEILPSKEFYYLVFSTLLFILIFILLRKKVLQPQDMSALAFFLIAYINWYYITFATTFYSNY